MSLGEDDVGIDADEDIVGGKPAPSARVALDRQRILAAALALIDNDGLTKLTMRALGAALGVEAMSLYRYVPGREDLLDGVVETIIDEMYDDENIIPEPTDGWRDYLQRLAHGVRRIALAHPVAFPLIASRPPEAPWLRPPLRNLQWVESFLEGLVKEGFHDEVAVAAYRAFCSFLLGHLLFEVAARGADLGPSTYSTTAARSPLNLAEYPQVDRMQGALAEDHSAAEFEESLENLLDQITLLRTNASV